MGPAERMGVGRAQGDVATLIRDCQERPDRAMFQIQFVHGLGVDDNPPESPIVPFRC